MVWGGVPGWGVTPPHACLHTGGLNLAVEIKLVSMGNFLGEHAERMIDFGNSLEIALPFLIRWVPSGNHGTHIYRVHKLRDFEINLFVETFLLFTYVVGVMYLFMVLIRSITQHNYRYHVLLVSNEVNPGAFGMGGGGLEPCPIVALHGWTGGLVWWVTVRGPGACHPEPGGLGWGPWRDPGWRGSPPLMPTCTQGV